MRQLRCRRGSSSRGSCRRPCRRGSVGEDDGVDVHLREDVNVVEIVSGDEVEVEDPVGHGDKDDREVGD